MLLLIFDFLCLLELFFYLLADKKPGFCLRKGALFGGERA